VISVAGEFDVARECELLNLVITLDPLPNTSVKLDLSEVTLVDSKGLDSIPKLQAYLHGRRCELVVLQPQSPLPGLPERTATLGLSWAP
jgi:anti-anti-sigma regulatory factor